MAYAEKRGKGPTPWRVRFKLPDGTWDSKPKFPTKQAALDHGREQEADVRRGDWRDPARGRITFGAWSETWLKAADVDESTLDRYRGILRNQALPRWGDTPLADIKRSDVEAWAKDLAKDYKDGTIRTIRGRFATILQDAVVDGLIDVNPASKRRKRGKWKAQEQPEKVWADARDVLAVAENCRTLAGQWAYVLVLLAAYTGMRWGELVGLEREFVWFDGKAVRVEWQLLQRDDGTFEKKEPKYGSKRTLLLPPFLTRVLRDFLAGLPEEQVHVFLRPDGRHPTRSGFADSVFRPAVQGRKRSEHGVVRPFISAVPDAHGLTPHGLRHGHKVWIDEGGAPRVASAARMGHRLSGVEEVYSHVSRPMETAIVEGLQRRWEASCRPAAGRSDRGAAL